MAWQSKAFIPHINLFQHVSVLLASLIALGFSTGCGSRVPDQPHEVTIPAIQGSGLMSELQGRWVTTSGVVTGDFQGKTKLDGFFLQDPQGDGRSDTSDALFVYSPLAPEVSVGDSVRVTGCVTELAGVTSLAPTLDREIVVEQLAAGLLVAASPLDAVPVGGEQWESLEGMLVAFAGDLTVTDTYRLEEDGTLVLSTRGRQYSVTNSIDPNDRPASGTSSRGATNLGAIEKRQRELERSLLMIDDGSWVESPNPVPFLSRSGDGLTTLRVGSSVEGLTGVVFYDEQTERYRVLPTSEVRFRYASRPPVPTLPAGTTLKVVAINVLNYFLTLAADDNRARGAESMEELQRQKQKIVAALTAMEPDVAALMELENNTTALPDLVAALNEALGDGSYAYVADPPEMATTPGGDDAIKVGIIYRTSSVEVLGPAMTIRDAAFTRGRAPVAQTFKSLASEGVFTVIVNHFKSKGGGGNAEAGDVDSGDGQGAFNDTRRRQAEAVDQLARRIIAERGDPDVLITGDLNAYAQEDPIDLLRSRGYVDLISQYTSGEPYSFVYRGQAGLLDHALATSALAEQVTAAIVWHINADEPRVLDYRQRGRDGQALYRPDPFRCSDHDPIIVGLRLESR
jgi:predicted extracellular nuclease